MRISSTEKVDRLLVTIDALKRLSLKVLEHTESMREHVNIVRWELHLRFKQQTEEKCEVILSSLPSGNIDCSLELQDPCTNAFFDTTVNTWACVCGQEDSGLMIMCNNDNCPHKWFHIECVGLSEAPEGDWLCPYCSD